MKKLNLFLLFLCTLGVGFSVNADKTYAVTAADWRPGRIIDDVVFQNKNSMTVDQIQQFLNGKVPVCDTYGTTLIYDSTYGDTVPRSLFSTRRGYPPVFTCLKDYVENPSTKVNNAHDPSAVVPGGLSAAQLIYNASQAQNINPQVFLVLLQKEQSLVTDTWPWPKQFERATGNNCPDTAPCNPAYAWLWTQVNNAGAQFNYYVNNFDRYNYAPGWNNILYHPNAACGRQSVFIENKYTAALYIYTPYVPNQAALNNMYGTGDGCSAYGNRNFWRMFNDWFGDSIRNLVSSNGAVYLIENGTKRIIPSAEVFSSYSFKWSDILFVSDTETSLIPSGAPLPYNGNYRNGQLISADGNAVWLVENGAKRIIPSGAVFSSYSFLKWSNIKYINSYEVSLIPDGAAMFYNVNYRNGQLVTADGNAVWLVENGAKRIIPSGAVFSSYSFKWANLVKVTTTELGLMPDGAVLPYKLSNLEGKVITVDSNAVWLVENGAKRIIPSGAVFSSYSFKWANLVKVTTTELGLMPDGAVLPYNASYRNGQLISADGNAVWLVENGAKRIIPSGAVFSSYSFKWADIKSIDEYELTLLPDGVVLPLKT